MGFHKDQFRSLIERVLREHNLHSDSAVSLLLGTAAQESKFGTYLRQLGGGPAVGIFQCEPATFRDLQARFGDRHSWIRGRDAHEMEWDLRLATLVCRLKYLSCPGSLPAPNDLHGLAAYWKRWYNTPLGSGTEAEFIENYRRYVGEMSHG